LQKYFNKNNIQIRFHGKIPCDTNFKAAGLRMNKNRLLVLGCSKRKLNNKELLPAIDRYDGPHFRILRRFRIANGSIMPQTLVISAFYGLIDIDEKIANYDSALTKKHNEEWIAMVKSQLATKLPLFQPSEIFIFGGKIYREVIEQCLNELDEKAARVAPKGGIGKKLNALKNWLERGVQG